MHKCQVSLGFNPEIFCQYVWNILEGRLALVGASINTLYPKYAQWLKIITKRKKKTYRNKFLNNYKEYK